MKNSSLILRPKDVCAELGISNTTFRRLVKAEKIKTVKLSERCIGVRRDVLNAYIENN